MNNRDFSSEGVVVDGPDGLREELARLFEVRQSQNPAFLAKQHFIIYTHNEQTSLIRVDLSDMPFRIYYGDLKRRAATEAVKREIGEFLNEKFPQHLDGMRSLEQLKDDELLVDLYDKRWKAELLSASIEGRVPFSTDLSMQDAHDLLSQLKRPEPKVMNAPVFERPASSPRQSLFGFFSQKPKVREPQDHQKGQNQTPGQPKQSK